MNTYSIKKIYTSPDWSAIPTLNIATPYLDTPNNVTASAQLCYNDEALLVHLWANEPYTRAEERGIVGIPCLDSCLEFFFCPEDGDSRYFNIEFNANGCMFLGFGSSVENLIRIVPEDPEQKFFPHQISKTEKGWEIFYSIPYSFIRRIFPSFEVYSGKRMQANCYKCSDLTEPANYLSWSPIVGEPFTFHKPHCFGTMIFE